MKQLLIGDLHGRDLTELDAVIRDHDPDMLICLGDFDQAKTIRQYMKIEERLKQEGKQVITVAGNHDVALIRNQPIMSGTMLKQGKDFYQLRRELEVDISAMIYLTNLVEIEPFRESTKLEGETSLDTLIIHAALAGNLESYPRCPPNERDVWYRLESERDYLENFKRMSEEGFTAIIRGHDHMPRYAELDLFDYAFEDFIPEPGESFVFSELAMHAINPGALFDGWYAVLETASGESPQLTYHRLPTE